MDFPRFAISAANLVGSEPTPHSISVCSFGGSPRGGARFFGGWVMKSKSFRVLVALLVVLLASSSMAHASLRGKIRRVSRIAIAQTNEKYLIIGDLARRSVICVKKRSRIRGNRILAVNARVVKVVTPRRPRAKRKIDLQCRVAFETSGREVTPTAAPPIALPTGAPPSTPTPQTPPPTITGTATPSPTGTFSVTPSVTPTIQATSTATPQPSPTVIPTATPTPFPTQTPTPNPNLSCADRNAPPGWTPIRFPADLRAMVVQLSGSFMQVCDIDLASESWELPALGFRGTFDGNGFTISNLRVRRTLSQGAPGEGATIYFGLFTALADRAIVRNVTLRDVDIEINGASHGHTGALTGVAGFETIIENVTASGSIRGSGNGKVGGLVGWTQGAIRDSSSAINIDVSSSGSPAVSGVGGIAGYANVGPIDNVYVAGSIRTSGSAAFVGGAVGLFNLTYQSLSVAPQFVLRNALVEADVSTESSGSHVGGVVGSLVCSANFSYRCRVEASHFVGNVNGRTYVGGVAGRALGNSVAYPLIADSSSSGTVLGQSWVGGVAGSISDTDLYSVSSTSLVSAFPNPDASGGLGCIARPQGSFTLVGGIAGSATKGNSGVPMIVRSARFEGSVSGPHDGVGGLFGQLNRGVIVERSFARAIVEGGASLTGGIAGIVRTSDASLPVIVRDSYSLSEVRGANLVGAIFGGIGVCSGAQVSVERVYGAGSLFSSGSFPHSPIAGSYLVSSSYYLDTLGGDSTSLTGAPRSEAQFAQQSTYAGWDFDSTWIMSPQGTPELRP